MCDACNDPRHIALPAPRRLKLWEIEPGWHCTIIGTCLTMGDLRAVRSKFGIRLKSPNPTDYEIHSTMVGLASRDRNVGKVMHKLLDRRHAPVLNRFAKAATPEQVSALWRDAVDKGEVAGAVWAAMSHAHAGDELRNAIFGEVHMLSHQVGSAARADLRRVHVLETEKTELEDKVARQQDRLRDEVTRRDKIIEDLTHRLELESAEHRRLAHAASAAAELDALKALCSELETHLTRETERRKAAEFLAQANADGMAGLLRERDRLQNEAEELRAENAVLDTRLVMALGGSGECQGECDLSCGRPDLCGRSILYVGGRGQQVPYLKRIVEECNGRFIHHDGGLEENVGRLQGLMGRIDAVMFPVDCISHMAHDHVKRLCKRWNKPFVPVRRSSLGAFMRALSAVPAAEVH